MAHRSGPRKKFGSRRDQQAPRREYSGPRGRTHGPSRSDRPERSGRWVVGIHSVQEVLRVRPDVISQVWIKQGWNQNSSLEKLHEMAEGHRLTIKEVNEGQLRQFADSHQGIAVNVSGGPRWSEEVLSDSPCILIALDEIEDPHNLGAILRTAWVLGAQGLLITQHRSASLTPSVMKVASGGAEHIPVKVVDSLPQELGDLKEQGFWILGLSHEASQTLWQMKIPEKVVWVLGSEEKGLRSSVKGVCEELVKIPQTDSDGCLNASVAAAVAIAETRRQHS